MKFVFVICAGIGRWWFSFVLSETPPHHWPLPVMKQFRLSPLREGYSTHHRCDEWLEFLDTHHTFTH